MKTFRRVVRWMRVVLPPPLALSAWLALYLFMEALCLWSAWWLGWPKADDQLFEMRDKLMSATCAFYGAYRVFAFHPAINSAYRQWLVATPWHSRKSLPLGPIHLVAQDAVVIGMVMLGLHHCTIPLLAVPLAFVFGHLAALLICTWETGPWWTGYTIPFLAGLAALFVQAPAILVVVATVACVVAYFGINSALAEFPWNTDEKALPIVAGKQSAKGRGISTNDLGWPYDRISPKDKCDRVRYRDGILVSLLIGWLLYVVGASIPNAEDGGFVAAMISFAVSLACPIVRLWIYCWSFWPPITLRGRLATGRWIIPGYDRVLVAPLCALTAAVAGPVALLGLGLPLGLAMPISAALVLMIALCMGPTLRSWSLTGCHRIMSWTSSSTQCQRL
jgi:hypothetical protein